MRRSIALLLTGTMVLSLSACVPNINVNINDKDSGNEVASITGIDQNSDGNNDIDENNQNSNPDVTQNPDSSNQADENDNPNLNIKYSGYPSWDSFDFLVENEYSEAPNGEMMEKVKTQYTSINVYSTEDNDYAYAELSDRLVKRNDSEKEYMSERFDELLKEWNETFSDVESEYYPPEYEIDHAGVIRADQKVFSIISDLENYYGGAHGGNFIGGLNLYSQTGEEIQLEDVFIKKDELAKVITDELWENYDPLIFFAVNEELDDDTNKAALLNDVEQNLEYLPWTVNYDGIAFYFGDYVLAAYASGHQIVYINFDEYPEYLNPAFFEDADEEYIIHAKANVYYPFLKDGKISTVAFDWEKQYNAEYDFYSDTYMFLNVFGDDYQQLDMEGSIMDPPIYIVRKNNKDYLYVQNYYFDGVEILQIFEYANGEFKEIGNYSGGVSFNSNELVDETTFYANGSFAGGFAFSQAKASVGEDGTLNLGEIYYYDIFDDWKENNYYETKADLKGFEMGSDNKPSSKEVTLKKGSKITPYCTDMESFIVLVDDNDNYYAFNIGWNDTEMTINKKTTFDLFDLISNWY